MICFGFSVIRLVRLGDYYCYGPLECSGELMLSNARIKESFRELVDLGSLVNVRDVVIFVCFLFYAMEYGLSP